MSSVRCGSATLYYDDLPDNFVLEGDLAVDTEAMGLNNVRDRLCLVQLSNGDGKAHMVNFKPGRYEAPNLRKLLSDPNRVKIFHYARFDLAVIMCYMGLRIENVYCTKVASRLCRTYTEAHSLRELCSSLLGVKISKAQQASDWGSNQLTTQQMEYAATDVLHLHKIREILDGMLKREGRYELALRCFGFLPTRAELDMLGWVDFDIFQHGGSTWSGGFSGGA
jgi:ribonuclease D